MRLYELKFQMRAWPEIVVYVVAEPAASLDKVMILARLAIQEKYEDEWAKVEPELHAAFRGVRYVSDHVQVA